MCSVVAVPTDAMGATNRVYIHPEEPFAATIRYIMVNGFPFTVEADPKVTQGTIAMNVVQRKLARVTTTTGDRIDLARSSFVPIPAIATFIGVEVEYISATKKGGTLDAKEFTKFFLDTFKDQYFAQDQQIAVLLDSAQKYAATVKKIEGLTEKDGGLADICRLTDDTKLVLTTKERCEITMINMSDEQVNATQQTIVNNFKLEDLGIGGLRKEFGAIFREAFASRIVPKSLVKKIGKKHVKGVLLYGPPGTGKTLIARKIGEILNCAPPKIVNGPDVFNKFVGGTEENVRKLFVDAEAEQASKGDNSRLHLIIFDEFDAICKQRGSTRDNTGVADNVVNQLLSKIDGVNSLNNVLLIGMTNRKDLLDEAILRPGRFEVHIEIGLADEPGREEIFRIHTRGMRENDVMDAGVDLHWLARETKNFSGAEIEGVVRSATAYAFNRHIDFENPTKTIDVETMKVTMDDFKAALSGIKPAFGQAKDECAAMMRMGIIDYGPGWRSIVKSMHDLVSHLEHSKLQSISVLMEGAPGSGKSAAAAHLAMLSTFPFVKVLSPDEIVGYGEANKSNIYRKAFDDAYKSPMSVIVLDDIERLVEYSHLGARYSNALLQTLLVLIKRPPPEGKKVLIIGTTSLLDVMESLEVSSAFSMSMTIPPVDPTALPAVVRGIKADFATPDDATLCQTAMPGALPVKKLILVLEMATEANATSSKRVISYDTFSAALHSTGLSR